MIKYCIGILYAAGLIFLAQGCSDFLDKQPDDMLSLNEVFAQQAETEQYLANVYSFIPPAEGDGNMGFGATYMQISDEADFGYPGIYANYEHNIGNWGPTTDSYNQWRPMYRGIRSASIFIDKVDECQQMSPELRARRKAEARLLRAYFYFILARQYGPLVIVPDAFEIDANPAALQQAQTPYDDVVNYIVSELDLAMPDLPNRVENVGDMGRVDQLVAKAIKARLLLYAASPLFNGNPDYVQAKNVDGVNLFSQSYDPKKWERAAIAAKEVIDGMPQGLYNPFPSDPVKSYMFVFLDRWNQETIWGRKPKNELWDWKWYSDVAPAATGGTSINGTTQQHVDAYFMDNGKLPISGYTADGSPLINEASGYTETGFADANGPIYLDRIPRWKLGVSNMYVNREPRFYASISFNGAEWINHGVDGNETYYHEFWLGGKDVTLNPDNYAKAGYNIRKFAHPNTVWHTNSSIRRWESLLEIFFRLSEFYLNYAEALNEYDPNHPDIFAYVNLIRERAGIPLYGSSDLPKPVGQQSVREAIRAERRVELAFEDLRIWDTRRWKIAEQTDNGPFYGISVKGGNHLSDPNLYKRMVFETRIFQKKHYLWPIPQTEMERNRKLVQNPYW